MAGPYDVSPPQRGASDARCPKYWQTLFLQQGVPAVYTLTLIDTVLDNVGDYSDGEEIAVGSSNLGELVRLVFRDHYTNAVTTVVVGQRTSADTFQFDFNTGHLVCPGLFVGEIIIYDNTSDAGFQTDAEITGVPDSTADSDTEGYLPVWLHRVFVEIEPSNVTGGTRYPLSIAELRLIMRDECPAGNFLIDDLEYADKEIFHAINRVVDCWNETPPVVNTYSYANFPFRFYWSKGVMGLLMRQAGRHRLRNWLPYTAGGITVGDHQIWQMYHQLGDQYWAEFQTWMRTKKVEQNIDGAFGGFSGGTTW